MDRTLEEVHSMGKKVERGIRQVENVVEPEKRASLVDNKRRAVRRCVKKFGERVRDMVLFGKFVDSRLEKWLTQC
ncbi:hypothetical protein V6N12_020725 [Hibiscus sabdariffa]|uniref:Uncharacterized protein n=1 Tax=Hibiscus sabdariffa TaxID=183260 RepID=A0ABR2CZT3_9ROSI